MKRTVTAHSEILFRLAVDPRIANTCARMMAKGDSDVVLVRAADCGSCAHRDRGRRRGTGAVTKPNTTLTVDAALKGPNDPTRIDVHRPAELRHWIRELGLPADQIKQAVNVVGPLVTDVRAFLQRRSLYKLR